VPKSGNFCQIICQTIFKIIFKTKTFLNNHALSSIRWGERANGFVSLRHRLNGGGQKMGGPWLTDKKMVAVGWVEGRNPTVARVMLGFAKLNPTYQNIGLSAVLSVSQGWPQPDV
jgi:hypothetical protein